MTLRPAKDNDLALTRRAQRDRGAFEDEDADIDQRGVDAEELRQLRVFGDRAHQGAEPGAVQHQP